MKIFLKIILWMVVLAAVGAGAFYGYMKYSKTSARDAFSVIPSDAIFVFETDNLSKGWTALSKNAIWQDLKQHPFFADLNEDIEMVDDLLKDNKAADYMLNNRRLVFSAHMISGVDFDFVFVLDLQEASKVAFIKELAGFSGYGIKDFNYNGTTIVEMDDPESTDKIYLAIIDNLLVGTFKGSLMERVVDSKAHDDWNNNPQFKPVFDEMRGKDLFNFYFNYATLPKFMKVFSDEKIDMIDVVAESILYSAFTIDLGDKILSLDGITNTDSVSPYINAVAHAKPGKLHAHRIISDKAAVYASLCFDNYPDFQELILAEAATNNADEFSDYGKNIAKVEKLMGISLNDDFFNWIGQEIAFVKLQPSEQTRTEDVIAIIHATDIDLAKAGLDRIITKVKNRSPLKFDTKVYRNFEINYLDIKGFFRMFFGKLFGKLERPYYTFIEDFVVFSNSEASLENFINDYTMGKTLERKESFTDFKDNFKVKTNLSMFVQTPKIYDIMYEAMDAESQKSLDEYKGMILSFARIGFSLIAEDGKFTNALLTEHDVNAIAEEAMESFELQASENLFVSNIEGTDPFVGVPNDTVYAEGPLKLYAPNSHSIFEGFVKDGVLNGAARAFFPSQNLRYTANFENGLASGGAIYYFDKTTESVHAEANFDDGLLNGKYREFYPNGAQRVILQFDDGVRHGEAQFFYETGAIKIEAEYKKGFKVGKWKSYNQNGELMSKERFRKGDKEM